MPAIALVGRDHVDLASAHPRTRRPVLGGPSEPGPPTRSHSAPPAIRAGLQHLDETGREFLGGQRGERPRAASTADGMWYAPTCSSPRGGRPRSCPRTRVDLGDERGRDAPPELALVRRCAEPAQVADDAAAERDLSSRRAPASASSRSTRSASARVFASPPVRAITASTSGRVRVDAEALPCRQSRTSERPRSHPPLRIRPAVRGTRAHGGRALADAESAHATLTWVAFERGQPRSGRPADVAPSSGRITRRHPRTGHALAVAPRELRTVGCKRPAGVAGALQAVSSSTRHHTPTLRRTASRTRSLRPAAAERADRHSADSPAHRSSRSRNAPSPSRSKNEAIDFSLFDLLVGVERPPARPVAARAASSTCRRP